jgi:16S rRNA (cytosine967-C5)-methyltransferase
MTSLQSRPLSEDMAQAARNMLQALEGPEASPAAKSPAISDLTYLGLRFWGAAQVRAARLALRQPKPLILALLAIAWAALTQERRPAHVLVNEAVQAAKILGGDHAGGFVNALLRKTLADADAAKNDLANPVARWNAPLWWIKKIEDAHRVYENYPVNNQTNAAVSVLDALVSRPPLTIRLFSPKLSAPAFLQLLSEKGLAGTQVGPAAFVVSPPVPADQIPGFLTGAVSVQDAAAQWAASQFTCLENPHLKNHQNNDPKNDTKSADQGGDTKSHDQILDACAAPGGKTIGLAQNYCGTVWAMDIAKTRLKKLQVDLARVAPTLQATIKPVVADVLQPLQWPAPLSEIMFNAILLDAPCSASGVARRHPEIAWRRTPQEVLQAANLQEKMLDVLWPRLKPGGQLLFVTCSVFPEEGELQAQSFLKRTPDAVLLDSPGRILPQYDPDKGIDQDGFYYAKFEKTDSPHVQIPST